MDFIYTKLLVKTKIAHSRTYTSLGTRERTFRKHLHAIPKTKRNYVNARSASACIHFWGSISVAISIQKKTQSNCTFDR